MRNPATKLLQFVYPLSQTGFDGSSSSPGQQSPNHQIHSPHLYSKNSPRFLDLFLGPQTPCIPQNYRSPTTNMQYPIGYPFYNPIPESRIRNQSYDQHDHDDSCKQQEMGEEEENDENEAIEEIVRGISELYLKLPLQLREQVTLEIMKRGINVTSNSTETGLNVGAGSPGAFKGPLEESGKLERFKIKRSSSE